MRQNKQIIFPPFRLDPPNQTLFRGEQELRLRPKSFAVLQYLAERPGRLVTKDELLDAVWPDTCVSDAVLKVCVREIRESLGDDQKNPRFIETAHRSGYRFIAEIRTSNLPAQLTSFIGREREIVEVRRLLLNTRLLTLTGAGGSGKTRLALEVADELTDEIEGGVWWVELASLSDPALVLQAVVASLGAREEPGRTLTETLLAHLRNEKSLLILDNCEHVVAGCASLVDTMLRACPQLKILATSRESLGVKGEITWAIPAMSLPAVGESPPVEELMKCEAVRLFVERASAALPRFKPTGQNVRTVAQICHRLDGIPLAIELAAARMNILSIEQIAARLDDCFRLLTTGSRTELPRRQTLRAAIDWSYDLLTAEEQALLRRLSVFAGGFTLEAVEAICPGETLDPLSRLIDKSLVIAAERESDGEARYRLLESVRQYGREKLQAAGEVEDTRRRHLNFFLRLAESLAPEINTSERNRLLARLEEEHDNFRAALTFAVEQGDAESGLRLAGALFWFWFHRGYWSAGREWIEKMRILPGAAGSVRARAAALFGEGVLAWAQGDHAAACSQLEESVSIWRELGDRAGLAHALHFLAIELLGQTEQGRARALAEESVAIFRAGNDLFGLAASLSSLGVVALAQADYPAAKSCLEESVKVFREMKDDWGLALPLRNLGIAALRQGDYERAASLLRESLRVRSDPQERWFTSRSLESLAEALAMQGDSERAARTFGASEALRASIGASVLPFYQADYDRGLAAVRTALGEEAFAAAWAEGQMMTLSEMIADALG